MKERQANVSKKGGRLAKKRENYFFVVEEILKNGNIALRDWNKNEIADKSVPPQQLKNIHMDEMRMDDFENSFKRHTIEESSGQTENMTSSNAESISPTTSPTTTITTNPITVLTYGMDNGREDAQTISLTTTPTTTLTTTQATILTDTEELVLGTNVYMTSTPTSSPNNNKQEEYGESSLTTTMITNENELKCENVFMNTKMTSSGNTMEVFTITNMTDSPITIMIPRFNQSDSSVYDDNTLPNLTKEEEVRIGNYNNILDQERTFMDENMENDCVILHAEPSPILKFSPLNSASREECRPLVNIPDCGIIPYTNIGGNLNGKPSNIYQVLGDGNYYFWCISYVLSGKEDYHRDVRKVLCKYISWFPSRLSVLITDNDELKNGCKYIERSGMMENGKWATEVEILVTAKCFRRDICTYYQNKWQRHFYLADYSEDAIYLINVKGHFKVVLGP